MAQAKKKLQPKLLKNQLNLARLLESPAQEAKSAMRNIKKASNPICSLLSL
ncbi:hypothetical protein IJF93_01785 [Candidatus Saccharibacteria bacterium]|nr:hypothetical protein [Candidatus Saccharibacteria bacterium]